MPSPERGLAQTVHQYLDLCVQRGWLVYLDRPSPKPGTSKEGMLRVKGGPDIIVWRFTAELGSRQPVSRVLCLELKSPTGKQQKPQREFQDAAARQGAWYKVVRSIEQVEDALREIGVSVDELAELQL